jgi:DNA-binding MarR family transcriptional regulator
MQLSPAAAEGPRPESAETSRATLARDLYALLASVMRSGTSEVFRIVGDLELSMTQIKALHILDANDDELTVKDLSERLTVSMPAMSRSIDGLLHRGFVERREDDDDRRQKRVRVTEAGRAVPRALNDARLSTLNDFIDGLDAEEVERLATALAPIAAREDVARCRPLKETE